MGHNFKNFKQANGNRQVKMVAFLVDIRRRKADRDPFGGQGNAKGVKSTADTVARFLHRAVGQANNVKAGNAWRNLHLNLDGLGVDACKCNGVNFSNHG